MTGCEYTLHMGPITLPIGILLSTVIGVVWAYAWYTSTRAMGASLFYDVHGVMMGLQPGGLRTSPLACAPQPA
jgi:ABC-type transporter Mla maintaining outer membrane lipid asymmetry permease subunit MlaE